MELKGTNVALLGSMMKQQIVADYTTIHTPIFQRFPNIFANNSETSSSVSSSFSIAEYKWALSIIWSRAFGITKGGEYLHVLCPALDMLNHDVHLSVPLDECIIYNESLAVG
jgi:hypothetical protein